MKTHIIHMWPLKYFTIIKTSKEILNEQCPMNVMPPKFSFLSSLFPCSAHTYHMLKFEGEVVHK